MNRISTVILKTSSMVGVVRWHTIAVCAVFLCMNASLHADTFGDFTYFMNSGDSSTVGITKYSGPAGSVAIPDFILGKRVTLLSTAVFKSLVGLTNVTIPNGVTRIGPSAFYGCSGLKDITLPANLNSIGDSAFYSCSNLANVTLPNSVTNIGNYAFSACNGLTNIFIPSALTSIGNYAFQNCIRLQAITVDSLNTAYGSVGDVLFNKSQTLLIQCPAGKTGNFSIPEDVTTINGYAFSGCAALTNVTVPASVTNIGESVFFGCSSLRSVYFGGNSVLPEPKNLFLQANQVTVYYRAEATGWSSTYAGRPTALWIEKNTYQQWAQSVGLLDKFPGASGETDDPDHDGMSNLSEMQAGTDPTNPNSVLIFESSPRLNDLIDGDKIATGPDQRAFYFQTVPGKQYTIQSMTALGGAWQTETNITATTTQKRFLANKLAYQNFYRIIVVP